MEDNQVLNMIGQYRQQGKDIDTLYSEYAALLSAGKTPLGLNQWVKSDKPLMEDFNEDNRIIDEKFRELEARLNTIGHPAEHPLPLAAGIVQRAADKCTYSKDAFGRVHVIFHIETSPFENTINSMTIATLPAGFRPDTRVLSTCIGIDKALSANLPGALMVLTNGNIVLGFGAKAAGAYGDISFIAIQ